MPGQTQPWRSSVGDGGVGAALEGGGRKRRARSVPVRASGERGGSGHLGEGAPTGAKQATARQTAGVRPAGCWALRRNRRVGGSRRSRNGAAVPSAMPRAARRVDRTARRFGGTCGASRVGDTAESSSCAPSRASVRTMRGGAGGPGTPVRTKHEGEEGASGQGETKRTVHAAWWSGPRLSGSTRGRTMCGRGPTPEDAASRCASPGDARGATGASEVRRLDGARRTTRSGNVRSAHRSEPLRREATAPHRVGKCGEACAEIWGDRL
jgi:hypothetical protein